MEGSFTVTSAVAEENGSNAWGPLLDVNCRPFTVSDHDCRVPPTSPEEFRTSNYHVPLAEACENSGLKGDVALFQKRATSPFSQGKVARYALGDDYHEIIKDRLHDLAH